MADIGILGPNEGQISNIGFTSDRQMISSAASDGRVSMVEHPMEPRALAAPLHRHSREDEFTYVLEGEVGAMLGEQVVVARAGDLIFKPRGQWHTFWNAGDAPARALEVISPSGFEQYFVDLGTVLASGPPEPQRLAALCARYGLEMNIGSVPDLVRRFGLRFPGPPHA